MHESVADCIDVGRITYNKADFYHTVVWMEHALQQLEREKPNMTESYYNRTQALILDFLSYATFEVAYVSKKLIQHFTTVALALKSVSFREMWRFHAIVIYVNFE